MTDREGSTQKGLRADCLGQSSVSIAGDTTCVSDVFLCVVSNCLVDSLSYAYQYTTCASVSQLTLGDSLPVTMPYIVSQQLGNCNSFILQFCYSRSLLFQACSQHACLPLPQKMVFPTYWIYFAFRPFPWNPAREHHYEPAGGATFGCPDVFTPTIVPQ